MIVKDEEMHIARCLESVADLVDEIIVVDTGSSDRTVEIASQYTTNIYFYPWREDFSEARNYSFSKASMEFCMWMDADDILEETEKDKLLQLKQTLSSDVDMVMMKYNTAFDEDGKPSFSYFRERWIRNCSEYRWVGAVHEVISPSGNIVYSDIAVSHKKINAGDPDRNLKIYQKALAEGKTLEPRQQYYYGRELYYHKKYEEAVSVLELIRPFFLIFFQKFTVKYGKRNASRLGCNGISGKRCISNLILRHKPISIPVHPQTGLTKCAV